MNDRPTPSIRWFNQLGARLNLIYAAARLRPLIIGVAIKGGEVHPVSDTKEITLGHWASITDATVRSRLYVTGTGVTVRNNMIELPEEDPQ